MMQTQREQIDNAASLSILFLGLQICMQILQTIAQWYVMLGVMRQCLYIARGGTGFQAYLMFPPLMMFLKFVGLILLLSCIYYGVMSPVIIPIIIGLALSGFSQDMEMPIVICMFVGAGCIAIPCCCVVIWLSIRLYLAQIFLADQNTGIVDSISYAWRVSAGNFWMLLVAMFVLSILSMLGMFFCCVGIFMTVAISLIGAALAYFQLTGQPNYLDYPQRWGMQP
jgi:hypothetical protein